MATTAVSAEENKIVVHFDCRFCSERTNQEGADPLITWVTMRSLTPHKLLPESVITTDASTIVIAGTLALTAGGSALPFEPPPLGRPVSDS